MNSVFNLKNKKAGFNYEFIDTYTAGLVLLGTEIKSIRDSKVSFNDAFCFFKDAELFIKNLHIGIYEKASHKNHEPLRIRKLLLHKNELHKLKVKNEEKGLTIVPVRIFINEKGIAKMDIALGRGKKSFDKRESIKKKDIEREVGRKFR